MEKITININSLIGTLIVIGSDVDKEKIEKEITPVLLSVLNQVAENCELNLSKCEPPEHDPGMLDRDSQ